MRKFEITEQQINDLTSFINKNTLTEAGRPLLNFLDQIKNTQEIKEPEVKAPHIPELDNADSGIKGEQ